MTPGFALDDRAHLGRADSKLSTEEVLAFTRGGPLANSPDARFRESGHPMSLALVVITRMLRAAGYLKILGGVVRLCLVAVVNKLRAAQWPVYRLFDHKPVLFNPLPSDRVSNADVAIMDNPVGVGSSLARIAKAAQFSRTLAGAGRSVELIDLALLSVNKGATIGTRDGDTGYIVGRHRAYSSVSRGGPVSSRCRLSFYHFEVVE